MNVTKKLSSLHYYYTLLQIEGVERVATPAKDIRASGMSLWKTLTAKIMHFGVSK